MFQTPIFLSHFSRTLGAHDKHKRTKRSRILENKWIKAGLGIGLLGAGIGSIAYIESKQNDRMRTEAEQRLKMLTDNYRPNGDMDDLIGEIRSNQQKARDLLDNIINSDEKQKEQNIDDKLAKDRSKSAGRNKTSPLTLDDPEFDKSISGKGRIIPRLKNLNRIKRGSASTLFPGLATDLHVIQNHKKYGLSRNEKNALIKNVKNKLNILKLKGQFSQPIVVKFSRTLGSKDKHKRRITANRLFFGSAVLGSNLPFLGKETAKILSKNKARELSRLQLEQIRTRLVDQSKAEHTVHSQKAYDDFATEYMRQGFPPEQALYWAREVQRNFDDLTEHGTINIPPINESEVEAGARHFIENRGIIGHRIGLGLGAATIALGSVGYTRDTHLKRIKSKAQFSFHQPLLLSHFSRRLGSKDKAKRKVQNRVALNLASVPIALSAPSIGSNIAEDIKRQQFAKRGITEYHNNAQLADEMIRAKDLGSKSGFALGTAALGGTQFLMIRALQEMKKNKKSKRQENKSKR